MEESCHRSRQANRPTYLTPISPADRVLSCVELAVHIASFLDLAVDLVHFCALNAACCRHRFSRQFQQLWAAFVRRHRLLMDRPPLTYGSTVEEGMGARDWYKVLSVALREDKEWRHGMVDHFQSICDAYPTRGSVVGALILPSYHPWINGDDDGSGEQTAGIIVHSVSRGQEVGQFVLNLYRVSSMRKFQPEQRKIQPYEIRPIGENEVRSPASLGATATRDQLFSLEDTAKISGGSGKRMDDDEDSAADDGGELTPHPRLASGPPEYQYARDTGDKPKSPLWTASQQLPENVDKVSNKSAKIGKTHSADEYARQSRHKRNISGGVDLTPEARRSAKCWPKCPPENSAIIESSYEVSPRSSERHGRRLVSRCSPSEDDTGFFPVKNPKRERESGRIRGDRNDGSGTPYPDRKNRRVNRSRGTPRTPDSGRQHPAAGGHRNNRKFPNVASAKKHYIHPARIAFHPPTMTFAAAHGGSLRVLRYAEPVEKSIQTSMWNTQEYTMEDGTSLGFPVFSDDGSYVFAPGIDGTRFGYARIVNDEDEEPNLDPGTPIPLQLSWAHAHTDPITCLACSGCGSSTGPMAHRPRVLTGAQDGSIGIWNVPSDGPPRHHNRAVGHTGAVTALTWCSRHLHVPHDTRTGLTLLGRPSSAGGDTAADDGVDGLSNGRSSPRLAEHEVLEMERMWISPRSLLPLPSHQETTSPVPPTTTPAEDSSGSSSSMISISFSSSEEVETSSDSADSIASLESGIFRQTSTGQQPEPERRPTSQLCEDDDDDCIQYRSPWDYLLCPNVYTETHDNPWLFASGGADTFVMLWDSRLDCSQGPLVSLLAHHAPIYTMAMSNQGKALISMSNDGLAAVWDLRKCNKPVFKTTICLGHAIYGLPVVSASDDSTHVIWLGGRLANQGDAMVVETWEVGCN